jgi:hypothetical protein
MTQDKLPLRIGAYDVCFEKCNFGWNFVVRRRDRPKWGHAHPSMALAIHHAKRLNRLYPQRKVTSHDQIRP